MSIENLLIAKVTYLFIFSASNLLFLNTLSSNNLNWLSSNWYSLLESNQDVTQFLSTIHRYVQLAVCVKGYMSKELGRFQREIMEVCEFYVDENNNPCSNVIYRKNIGGGFVIKNPTKYLLEYLELQGVILPKDTFNLGSINNGDSKENIVEIENKK